jgi:hypothetical protein
MTGTMGLGLAAFVPIWTLMMAAMMLPSVTPTATLYANTMQHDRAMRITGLVAGYLAIWAVAGLPAYGLAWLAGWLTGTHPSAAHVLAVAVFAVCARGRRRAGSCGGHHLAPLARPRPAGCTPDDYELIPNPGPPWQAAATGEPRPCCHAASGCRKDGLT